MFTTVRCVVVRVHGDRIVFSLSVADGDAVVMSHNNSIYNAPVEEHLEIQGGYLVLKEVRTNSQGVREYYGIADGMHLARWPAIRVFSTGDRAFSLTIRGVPVEAFKKYPDARFVIEIIRLPLYHYVLRKLYVSV